MEMNGDLSKQKECSESRTIIPERQACIPISLCKAWPSNFELVEEQAKQNEWDFSDGKV